MREARGRSPSLVLGISEEPPKPQAQVNHRVHLSSGRSKGKAKREPFSKRKALKKIVTLQRKGRKLKPKAKAVAKKDTKAADAKVEACNVELEEYQKGLATTQKVSKSLITGMNERVARLHRRINGMAKARQKAQKPPHHPPPPPP
jgi:hypothetical protein